MKYQLRDILGKIIEEREDRPYTDIEIDYYQKLHNDTLFEEEVSDDEVTKRRYYGKFENKNKE